jgi:non-specific serine/threonine protein kinase/serine/threonine-protein kinase
MPPETIGPFRILERIGSGGMGVVFRAEQRTPIRREVAIKSIKMGMDTKAVIARFEAERQALALMDHPHIAKVLDAGADELGRPYFVMEYVKGKPITEYCDQHCLTIRERLELFQQICQAIQHAHHKGIIHRDLKPTNVLVSTQDDRPFAKIIDFGIAKAVSQQLTEKTLFTRHDQFIGTPEYMSPEQAEGSLDIDTRTDVYSLGVLLYELLTGSTPFTATELRVAAFEQLKKLIRESDPPLPSSRISHSNSTLPQLAAFRKVEPRRLGLLVRGELDWIALKALEKDRQRRYDTPTMLANDIGAFLKGETVQAAPPSTVYRVTKAIRRNKGTVAALTAICLSVLAGLIGTTWGFLDAARIAKQERIARSLAMEARDAERTAKVAAVAAKQDTEAALIAAKEAQRAETLQRQKAEDSERRAIAAAAEEKAAKINAEAREAEANAVLQFVERHILLSAMPKRIGHGMGVDVKLRDAIRAAIPAIDRSFKDQSAVEARLRSVLGDVFEYWGERSESLRQYQRVVEIHKAIGGLNANASLEKRVTTAKWLYKANSFAEALTCLKELQQPVETTEGIESFLAYEVRWMTARCYSALNDSATAIKLTESLLQFERDRKPQNFRQLGYGMRTLADLYLAHGQEERGIELLVEAVDVLSKGLGEHDSTTVFNVLALGQAYDRAGRLDLALPLIERVASSKKGYLGLDHPNTVHALNYLSDLYKRRGRFSDQERVDAEIASIVGLRNLSTAQENQPRVVTLANQLIASGKPADALALLEAFVGTSESDAGTSVDKSVFQVLVNQYKALALHDKQIASARRLIGVLEKETPVDQLSIADLRVDIAGAEAALENFDAAAKSLTIAVEMRGNALGAGAEATVALRIRLGGYLRSAMHHEKSLELERATRELVKANLPKGHPCGPESLWGTAMSLHHLDRTAEAISVIDECFELGRQARVPPQLHEQIIKVRFEHFLADKQFKECVKTCEMWESLDRADPLSLLAAATYRAEIVRSFPGQDEPGKESSAELAYKHLANGKKAGLARIDRVLQQAAFSELGSRQEFRDLVD